MAPARADNPARADVVLVAAAATSAVHHEARNLTGPMPTSPNISLLDYAGAADATLTARAFVSEGRGAAGRLALAPMTLKLPIGPRSRSADLPLISCLMPTKDRFELARLSIGCFRRQSWPNKELVVLDASEDGRLARWIASLNDPAIRFFPTAGSTETLGEVRNRSMDLARGQFVCQWDDDDLQHPARLEIACAAMVATKAAACFLAHETLWMPHQQRIATLPRGPWPVENTILTVRDPAFRYPALPRGEDTVAVRALMTRRRVVLLDLPELYLYIVHGRNTWDAEHMAGVWNVTTDRSEGGASEARLRDLARAYPIAEYLAAMAARNGDSGNAVRQPAVTAEGVGNG